MVLNHRLIKEKPFVNEPALVKLAAISVSNEREELKKELKERLKLKKRVHL